MGGAIVAESFGVEVSADFDRIFAVGIAEFITVDGNAVLGEQDASVIINGNETKRMLRKIIS
jgi:hypothetical protein